MWWGHQSSARFQPQVPVTMHKHTHTHLIVSSQCPRVHTQDLQVLGPHSTC